MRQLRCRPRMGNEKSGTSLPCYYHEWLETIGWEPRRATKGFEQRIAGGTFQQQSTISPMGGQRPLKPRVFLPELGCQLQSTATRYRLTLR
jgi:hypothetical protein